MCTGVSVDLETRRGPDKLGVVVRTDGQDQGPGDRHDW